MDYISEFGVDHKIPRYDKVSWIKVNNIDALIFTMIVIYLVYRAINKAVVLYKKNNEENEKQKDGNENKREKEVKKKREKLQ
jgi:amino acid permease